MVKTEDFHSAAYWRHSPQFLGFEEAKSRDFKLHCGEKLHVLPSDVWPVAG